MGLIDANKLIEQLRLFSEAKPLPVIDTQLLKFVEEVIGYQPLENEWVSVSDRFPKEGVDYVLPHNLFLVKDDENSEYGYSVRPFYDNESYRNWWLLNIKAWKPVEQYKGDK